MRSLRVYARVECARVLGPGKRAGIWVQGCSRHCPGCFNPETHDPKGGALVPVDDLDAWLVKCKDLHGIEGVTISGGEPMDQPESLRSLLVGAITSNLTTVVYTGYTYKELRGAKKKYVGILPMVDILISGPFVKELACGGLKGSSNKQVTCLGRYTPRDLEGLPEVEVILRPDGAYTLLGTHGLEDL